MGLSAVLFSAVLLSASVLVAQTGFSPTTYPAALPAARDNTRLLTADLNGDGRPDLVSYGSRSTRTTAGGSVFLNNGSGGFLAPVALPGSGYLEAAQIGDMNGDGYPDIVGCVQTGSGTSTVDSVVVYLNNGTGSFTALPPQQVTSSCNALTLGDVNKDGHLDVITVGYIVGAETKYGYAPGTNNYITTFLNDWTGKVTLKEEDGASFDDPNKSSSFTNCGLIDVVGGDFAQDGQFSLILTTDCLPLGKTLAGKVGTTFLARGNSSESPSFFYNYVHLGSAYEDFVHGRAVDVDGDGKLDVLFAGVTDPYNGDLTYMRNAGNGSFTLSREMGAAYLYGSAVADFNGDGVNDIATSYVDNTSSSGPAGPPMMTILGGLKNGTFTDSQDFTTGPKNDVAGDVVAADFNGDGKPDLATLVYDTNTRTTALNVYTNTQAGSSNACSAPKTANTNKICSPAQGATFNAPVTVNAASNVAGFTLNRLYLDNKSVYQSSSQAVSTTVSATTGPHTLVLVSYNNQGQGFSSSTSFTVGNATGNGCIPSAASVKICSPTSGSTDNSPVTITAGARAQSGNITSLRIYVDNVARGTFNNPSATSTFEFTQGAYDFGPGMHHLVVMAYQSTGGSISNSTYFNQPSASCNPSQPGATICSPAQNTTSTSPVTVVAGVTTGSGYVTAIRVYVDNVAKALVNNPQKTSTFSIQQSTTIVPGTHALVVVGYPSTGGSISAQETITVQ